MQIYESLVDNPKLLNPITLAFVGDAVYEVYVRSMLALSGEFHTSRLHEETVKYVCATAQAQAYEPLSAYLTEEELSILKRGRNSTHVKAPKNANVGDYRKATGIEALIGFLYLKGQKERLEEILHTIWSEIPEQSWKK